MVSNWLKSSASILLLLVAGVVLITFGFSEKHLTSLLSGALVLLICVWRYVRSQKKLRERCEFMLEAIRANDYSFRLPISRSNGSELVLQDTLNRFGQMMGEQKRLMEQRERYYEQILATVTTGVVVLDPDNKVIQTNQAAATLLDLPILSTLKQLDRYGEEVSATMRLLEPGERRQLHFSTSKGETNLSIRAVRTELNMEPVRILILNDIRDELDEKELDSWIKLTRILTHEIMNSIAPISSISETFLHRPEVMKSELYEGIRAIHDTSSGLVNFVDSYRKFSSLQQPSPEAFYLKEILKQIIELKIIPSHIQFQLKINPKELMVYADPNLIRQLFINLLKNAVQAIGDNEGIIQVKAFAQANEHVLVQVSNNGPVIPDEVVENIFVPFFTTKKGGSGIGLSLSRQIMKMSNGSISLLKAGTNGWNTTFVVEFE